MLPTVTIESTRLISTFDMLLMGSIIVIAAIAWMTFTNWRHHDQHRHR
ncbi:MAG: hypothetical protein ACHQHL_07765 [Steroidobacterales bacterium]|jgi:hypothetical protein